MDFILVLSQFAIKHGMEDGAAHSQNILLDGEKKKTTRQSGERNENTLPFTENHMKYNVSNNWAKRGGMVEMGITTDISSHVVFSLYIKNKCLCEY